MIKVSMLATLLAGLAMGSGVAANARPAQPAEARDAKIIIELDRSLDSLTKQGVKNVQNIMYNRIKESITSNIDLVSSYSVLNNAFAISINSKYVDSVRALPGVKSVTLNKLRYVTQSVSRAAPKEDPDPVNDYGGKTNQSAVTMNLEEGTTNDGEGTVIAILDNEFFFRAPNKTDEGFKHETFTDLDDSVKVRWSTRPDVKQTHVYNSEDDDRNKRWKDTIDKTPLGQEGSLYFSKKIPFYFDYGGDPDYYGADPDEDFDVSSTRDYHGSHVASIASGNSPYYKGIAPKAQLVCMKVFTSFKANKTDLALGFQNASGAYDIPILNALEDCITLGVDGINCSFGSNLDDFDTDTITNKTLSRLRQSGILTSISAGNNGKTSFSFAGGYGNWTNYSIETGVLGGNSNNVDAMGIASGHPGKTFYASAFKMNGVNVSYQDQVVNVGNSLDYEEDEEHRISDLITPTDKTLPWEYIPGFGNGSDYSGKDVMGKIAVVNRGNIDFSTKVKTAKEKGAIGVVIINNDPTASDFNFRCSFGEYKPPIPVCLVLMKDKTKFSENTETNKTFEVVKNEIDVNPKANTISDFSSDGATFDLDLKPEITAPGDNIRGAVPPQRKEDKKARPYSTYEFLSGTSMSAPNYAGAQSVVLSKKAVALKNDAEAYNAYRNTVDMRLMSTATPMNDYEACPEDGETYKTSPRIQGAGMANIGNAYNTDVYLEGLDLKGNPIQKSKIALRNNSQINNGTVSLKFLAHNDSNVDKKYDASFTIMRPAIKESNEIVARNYNYRGEVDSFSSFPGRQYYGTEVDEETHEVRIVERHTTGNVAVGDVFKVTKELEYNMKGTDPVTGEEVLVKEKIAIGRYCCTKVEEVEIDPTTHEKWLYATYEDLESSKYQSTQDVLIKTSAKVEVTVKANGTTKITLPSVSLTNDEKKAILDFYQFGTYLEGFLTLESKNNDGINLSMPWMGFFGGSSSQTYEDAPVIEPFGFEKDATTIYPSELVNDIGYSLLGKSNIDTGSTFVTTYIEPGKEFDDGKILKNDESLSHLAQTNSAYHLLGTDSEGNYYANAKDNLYAGNPLSSNTLLVQQFMLRSVDDNYYTIKNKASGKVYAKDALEDILFGDRYGRFPLYKSNVDSNYLGGGYIAHRAWGVIPLYDQSTGESFPAGDYEIKFNYLLAGTGTWVSKAYTLHLCTEEPSINKVSVSSDKVRFYYNNSSVDAIKVGKYVYEQSAAELAGRYIELTKERIEDELEANFNRSLDSGRLFIELSNKAYGRTGAIVRFEEKDGELDFSKFTIVEHYSFNLSNDFEDLGNSINYYKVEGNTQKLIQVDDYARVRRWYDKPGTDSGTSSGCGGNIATTSILLSSLAGAFALILVLAKRRRKLGGKE